MDTTLKFTFDTAFGTKSDGQDIVNAIPIITQADVDAARTQGFVAGRKEGLSETSGQNQLNFENNLLQISNKLGSIFKAQTTAHQKTFENAQNLALLIAKKIAKAALDQYPTKQVKTLINDCLSHNNSVEHLVVKVNQELYQKTQDELQSIIEEKGYKGKLVILGDENITVGDCLIEWNHGGISHSTDMIISRIDEILKEYFVLKTTDTDDQTQDILEGNDDE